MVKIALASFRREPAGSAFCYRQDIVNEAYTGALLKAGAIPVILPHLDEKYAEEAISGFSALLIPGGHDIDPSLYGEEPAFSKNPDKSEDLYHIALVKAAIKAEIPVLGICRGLQIINVALGGSLFQDIEKQCGTSVCHRAVSTPYCGVHNVAIKRDSALYSIFGKDSICVNSLHHQCIKRVGEGLSVTATADDGVIEAVEGRKLMGVQWHPEAMPDEMESLFISFVREAENV